MYRRGTRITYSPGDLSRFMESRFVTWMNRLALEQPGRHEQDPAGEELDMLRRRGNDHERQVLEALRAEGRDVHEIPDGPGAEEATLEALASGCEVIYQGSLSKTPFAGRPDFLLRRERPSRLGDWSYEPLEAKLARRPKPPAVIQLCAYAEMLEAAQGLRPERLHVRLGSGESAELRTLDYWFYYRSLYDEFLRFMTEFDEDTRPVPEQYARHAPWATHAESALEELDHLSGVAGITSAQVRRLEAHGIESMAELAARPTPPKGRALREATYRKLHDQARLQVASRGLDRPLYEIVPPDHQKPEGLALLPPASRLDVFFDMEGYPLGAAPLEYLFGATHVEDGERRFSDWWAHDAEEECLAFEEFIDWVTRRVCDDPTMHVYHYGAYEVSAIRRLMGLHGTREVAIDALFKHGVFVDLYDIVRDGIRIGEPRYSIKNVEKLYRDDREAEVSSAVDSIVYYDRWTESGEPRDWRESPILNDIRDYNRDDCDSTLMLVDWLRGCQEDEGIGWAGEQTQDDDRRAPRETPEVASALLERAANEHDTILGQLVEFHRREDRPMWWTWFDRHEMNEEQLIEDLGCLGGLERTHDREDWDGNWVTLSYRFDPEQDTKLRVGDRCSPPRAEDVTAEIVELDLDAGRASVKLQGAWIGRLGNRPPERLSLIPKEYIGANSISSSIQKTAERWLEVASAPDALLDFLDRRAPRLRGIERGRPLIAPGESPTDAAMRVVPAMDGTTLSIQGPPGTGKTTISARVILELIRNKKRVGVTSNSHKAILNLMIKCGEMAQGRLSCLKAGGARDDRLFEVCPFAEHEKNFDAAPMVDRFPLVGGTAWLFSRHDVQGKFDYLFVDEAGQVSVANLVGMARASKNIVLVGDQMQLPQPIQGSHPGDSGLSTLDYLLGDRATVPEEMGLFLGTTYRLHPDLCGFISSAFYEDRLVSAEGRERRVVRRAGRDAGVVFVPVEHEGNTQASAEEVDAVAALVDELIGCERTDVDGNSAGRLTEEHILVVAPYNLQVRKLQQRLREGVRVGTVDKFQGQEAPVVIVSLCASEGHGSPRGLDFLLQPNRLNVALSRAQSLAFVVGHPGLARTRASTVEQMCLINRFCGIVETGSLPQP
ncbi:MAG: TM0106 family RecB-like putative nuclease [bacterium]|nr:TM0106 family RecB-like putative nuclease [bacterium]